jgi:tetratricopeptide (TPR) repeat protein
LSLLADLLSKIKHKEQQVVIPPNLAQVVHRASGKRKVETRIKVVLLVALLLVACGFGTIYLANKYLKSLSPNLASRRVQEPEDIKTEQASATEKNAPVTKTKTVVQQAKAETVQETKEEAETATNPASTLKEPPKQEDKKVYLSTNDTKNRQRRDNTTSPLVTAVKKPPQSEKPGKLSDLEETSKNEKDVALYTAGTYEQNKNYSQAITHYKKALEKDPKNYLIMNNLANVLIKTGSFKESIQYSTDALTVQKNYIPSLVNMGVANIQLGNMAEGEMYLLKAKSIEQSNKTVLFNLGLLYEKTSNYKESLAAFQKLTDMKDTGGYLGMARILEKQGNRSEAEKIYKEILSMDNIDPATRQLANERLQVIGNRQ